MSNRGVFIGQIIDDLDAIASKVKTRCALGQTDLNRILEDFFKELLNLAFNANLKNLNKHRSNAPGLDLGDATSPRKIAFQITSQADAGKVNKTLRTITDEQLKTFNDIYVFIIGRRQKSYSLDAALATRCRFNERNILGITELCREIMDLELAGIQAIQQKLASEQQRIRIELEPEINGTFETTALNLVEAHPSVRRSDASLLFNHPATEGLFDNQADAAATLDAFIDELQKLPRLTREMLGWLIDNSDRRLKTGTEEAQTNADYVSSKWGKSNSLEAELRLLNAWGFADFERDESHKSGWFNFYFPGAQRTDFPEAFLNFVDDEEVSVTSMFSTMNFTVFGPEPTASTSPVVAAKDKPKKKKKRRGAR